MLTLKSGFLAVPIDWFKFNGDAEAFRRFLSQVNIEADEVAAFITETHRREIIIEADDDLVPLGGRPLVGLFVPAAAGNEVAVRIAAIPAAAYFFHSMIIALPLRSSRRTVVYMPYFTLFR